MNLTGPNLTGPAAARLYDEHVDAIYAYIARRVGPEIAVDVVGEVFEQALRKHGEDVETKGTERGRLLAIATAYLRRHSAIEHDRLVRWGRDQAIAPTHRVANDPLLSVWANEAASSRTSLTMAAVAELEPADRDLLFLVAWERCTTDVAAEAVGIPPGNVKSRLSVIRKELKRRTGAGAPVVADEDSQ